MWEASGQPIWRLVWPMLGPCRTLWQQFWTYFPSTPWGSRSEALIRSPNRSKSRELPLQPSSHRNLACCSPSVWGCTWVCRSWAASWQLRSPHFHLCKCHTQSWAEGTGSQSRNYWRCCLPRARSYFCHIPCYRSNLPQKRTLPVRSMSSHCWKASFQAIPASKSCYQ